MDGQKDRFRELPKRSVLKAVTYRLAILIIDFGVLYLLTKKVEIALGFMLISNVYTTVAYYLHKRVWNAVAWGRKNKSSPPPEAERGVFCRKK